MRDLLWSSSLTTRTAKRLSLSTLFHRNPASTAWRYNERMPNILLNGEPRELRVGINLTDLLETAGFGGRKVAVEINREIVPKSRHAERVLTDGDRVEIVHAMGGG